MLRRKEMAMQFIGNEKIYNKFDISRFIQNNVSNAPCNHYRVLC